MKTQEKDNLYTETDLRKKNIIIFCIATACIGFAFITTESVISNYYDSFGITSVQRGWLEFPRELPGLLLALISGVLFYLGSAKMASIACILGSLGLIGLGYVTPSYGVMIIWMFIYNAGTHIWMPIRLEIGMAMAKDGKIGKQLARFDMVRAFSGIIGGGIVFFGFRFFHFQYKTAFLICALSLMVAAFALTRLKIYIPTKKSKIKLVFKKKYMLYYVMCIFNGARKQITITFAPWLLIRIFARTPDNMLIIGIATSVLGIVVYPLMGSAIDKLGEKVVLAGEAVILATLCAGYTLINSELQIAVYIVTGCYIFDRLLAYAGNARSTYVKKIAENQDDVLPTISTGISLDHMISMTIPAVGGYIWHIFGYKYVFAGACMIAIINLLLAIKIPGKNEINNIAS